jgi:pyruvate/2-oxoglutarate dehydrogenase complex dihydrolipoamide acyltransferase (E2) component
MAKKKNKALKSLEKDVAKLRKRNDKLARAVEKTREDQAAAYEELRNLLEERLPAEDGSSGEPKDNSRDGDENPEATDAAARRAEEMGIDLSNAKGTGAGGRILVKDVEAAASRD